MAVDSADSVAEVLTSNPEVLPQATVEWQLPDGGLPTKDSAEEAELFLSVARTIAESPAQS